MGNVMEYKYATLEGEELVHHSRSVEIENRPTWQELYFLGQLHKPVLNSKLIEDLVPGYTNNLSSGLPVFRGWIPFYGGLEISYLADRELLDVDMTDSDVFHRMTQYLAYWVCVVNDIIVCVYLPEMSTLKFSGGKMPPVPVTRGVQGGYPHDGAVTPKEEVDRLIIEGHRKLMRLVEEERKAA